MESKYFITYCKFADEKRFKAYDLNRGLPVANIIYATMSKGDSADRAKLQRLADLNKDAGLTIQLRDSKKVIFQTI